MGNKAISVLQRCAREARSIGRRALSEAEGKSVLAATGIAVPNGRVVPSPEDVGEVCENLVFPVAVKGVSPDLVHKSDAGAVRLNLQNAEEVRVACTGIAEAVGDIDLEGYLIEEMAPSGHEVIVGGIVDPQFGPVVMVGLGGVFVEVFADIAFRICPIEHADAISMLSELKALPLLKGARGGQIASREAIVDTLLRIGGIDGLLYRGRSEIAEFEVNPLIVSAENAVAADVRIVLSEMAAPADTLTETSSAEQIRLRFRPLFAPRNIAVVGASATRRTRSNTVIDQILCYGFDRKKIYPIHPTAAEIDGLRAYPSLRETPEAVDYAYVAIPAEAVPDLLSSAEGRLAFAHVTSSGFAEFGRPDLQDDLVTAARVAGVRVIGPNCNGGHSPRGKLTFCYDAAPEAGSVGIILQSGGLGIDTIRRGNNRGLRFSGVMTVGNCADVSVADLLEFYLADPETRVVGMYLEGAPEGRRLFDLLRTREPAKPVVILKGGRSERGRDAAVSHTGTLAGDDRLWDALARQTGVVFAATFDDFIDQLLALQCLSPRQDRPTTRAMLLGNGGGTSVLGVDTFARAGIDIAPFAADTIRDLRALGLQAGAAYSNPVDLPQPVLVAREGKDTEEIMRLILDREDPQAVVIHVNLAVVMSLARDGEDPLKNLLDVATRVRRDHPGKAHFLLVLRSDGTLDIEGMKIRYRGVALERGIPAYDEMPAAANAVSAVAYHEHYLARRR